MGGLRETDSSNPRPAPSSDFITNDYSSHLAKLCDLPLGFDPSHYPDLHAFYLYCKKGKQRAVTPVQQGSGGGEVHADALLLKKEQLAQRQMEIEVFVELWTNKVARDKVEKGASTLTAGQTDSERFAVLDANAVGDSASGKVSGLVSSVGESGGSGERRCRNSQCFRGEHTTPVHYQRPYAQYFRILRTCIYLF